MQKQLISKKEAARILEVAESTVGRYWRKGTLSYRVVGNRRLCIYEEVVSLMDTKNLPFSNIKNEIISLKYKVQQLERELELLKRKANIESRYTYTDEDLIRVYKNAKALDPTKLRPAALASWANLLLDLKESDYSRLKVLTQDPFPWSTFLKLVDEISLTIKRKRTYDKSASLQKTMIDLQFAKDRVRERGNVVLTEEGGGTEGKASFLKSLSPPNSGPISLVD